ncbi:uncharacterized protein DEA37_0009667 [Paragonimus westermani]|uniref:Uncharacterized protein n=1 Tax=Paragonimus westermani TaxID=34504 RepID=A0A5J4NNG0_9TREM|nr:uncharacterized protein DEA37_0009667 [Paragonimus westermani]
MANDRDSSLEERNDAADNDVAQVKAILCRAPPCDNAREEVTPEIESSEQKPINRVSQYDAISCPSVTRPTYMPRTSLSEQLSHPDFRVNTDVNAIIHSSALQQNSTPTNEIKYPFATTVEARTISQQLHQSCYKQEPGITYLAEQLERKRTPHLYVMEQKQPSPTFILGTPTDSHQATNLSLDTTIPPLTTTSPRWPLLNPANLELNELIKDVSLHNFQTVLNGAQRELGYDDTSGMSACTCMRSSSVEEPSVTSQKTLEFNVNKTAPNIRILRNLTPRSQPPSPNGLNSKPSAGREVRYHVWPILRDELQSGESASLVSGSPSTFLVLAQANVSDQLPSNSRRTEKEATVGAGDHILVGSSKTSHSGLSGANRYWDEASYSKTVYHVVRRNIEASRQRIKSGELGACKADKEERDELREKTVTVHGSVKVTASQHDDGKGDRLDRGYVAANSMVTTEMQAKGASLTTHSSRIPTLKAHDFRTLNPSQESVIREQATFSFLPSDDIVLVEGCSTPVSWRNFSTGSCNENHFDKQSVPTTTTTGVLNQLLINQPLSKQEEHISEKCAETTNPTSCCKINGCECSISSSYSESRTYQCDYCQSSMNVTSEAHTCADNVFDRSSWKQQKQLQQKSDSGERNLTSMQNKYYPNDHVCDTKCDPSLAGGAKQSTDGFPHSEGQADESTGPCSTCSESSSYEASCSRSVPCEPSQAACVAGRTSHAKRKNHVGAMYDKRSPLRCSYVGVNATNSLPKQREANNFISVNQSPQPAFSPLNQPTQADSGTTPSIMTGEHMRHREGSAWKQHFVSKPTIKGTQRCVEGVQAKDIQTSDKNRLIEPTQGRLSIGKISEDQEWAETKKRLQQRLKRNPHLDTLFNLVGEKEKRNTLQRWLLEQVAYSAKKNRVRSDPNSAIANQQYGEGKSYEENSDTECSCSKCRNPRSVDSGERGFSENESEDSRINSSVLAGESGCCLGKCNPLPSNMLVDANRTKDRTTTTTVGAKCERPQQSPLAPGATDYQWDKIPAATDEQRSSKIRPLRSTSEEPRYILNGTRRESPGSTRIHKRTSRFVGRGRIADSTTPGDADKLGELKEKSQILSPTVVDDYRPTPNGCTTTCDKPVRKGLLTNGNETSCLVKRTLPKVPFSYDTCRPQAGPTPGLICKSTFSSQNMRPAWSNRAQKPSPSITHTGILGRPEKRSLFNLRNPQATSRLLSTVGSALNSETTFEVRKIFEVSQYDDLVKSHLNVADRRIKAVGLKNGCEIKIIGPITSSDHPASRSKVSYQCQISAPTEDRIWKCINFLKETFPNSFLRSSWRA